MLRSLKVCATVVVLIVLAFSANAQTQTVFFPIGVFDSTNAGSDRFVRAWYSRQLAAMDEPSLLKASATGDTYRFTWLRTFRHPIAVRVQFQKDGSAELTATETSGAGGYAPGKILTKKSQHLDPSFAKSITEKLGAMSFWSLPTKDPKEGASMAPNGSSKVKLTENFM